MLKWKIIDSLRAGAVQELQSLWKTLRTSLPNAFGELFEIFDPLEKNSAFGRALQACQVSRSPILSSIEITDVAFRQREDKIQKLSEILSQSNTPIRREELIEKVWNKPYDPSLDTRFYKLMERFKKLTKRKVLNLNRAYLLC